MKMKGLVRILVQCGMLLRSYAEAQDCNIVDPYALESTPVRESMRSKHMGVEITVKYLVFQDCFISEKMRNFEQLTGAIVTKSPATTATWYDDILQDVKKKEGFIDAYGTFGNWVPYFASLGGFRDISDDILNAVGEDWFDIMPAIRQGVASYKEKVYAVPLDGDVIYMLYRKDLVEDKGLPSPKSWDDVKQILEYYEKNKTYNDKGQPVYGNCFATARYDIADKMFWALASPFLQTGGKSQGVFFDTESMDPVSNTPEFLEALETIDFLVQHSTFKNQTSGEMKGQTWQETRAQFNNGQCVLYYNYPGPIKSMISAQEANGFSGNLNLAPLPGKKCREDESCPYASEDGVNYAPFLASGGMAYAVNGRKSQKKQEAALAFALYLSDPGASFWDVAHPSSFLDPLRLRHTASLANNSTREAKAFLDFGWEPRQLPMLKETTEMSFLNKNYVLDLRVLGSEKYQEEGSMPHLIKMWKGETSVEKTAEIITDTWNRVTETFGLKQQRDFYRDYLGLSPYIDPSDGLEEARQRLLRLRRIILSVTIPIGILAILLTIVVAKQRHTIKYHTRDVRNAPKVGTVAIIFTDIEDSTALWETNKHAMQKSLDIHNNVIRSLIDKYEAYEVKTVGDSFMIATNCPNKAVMLANDIQEMLISQDWPLELATMPSSCISYFPRPRRTNTVEPPRLMFKGLRVRVGVHMGHHQDDMSKAHDGEIQILHDKVSKGFDYYGPVVNTAARIEDAAFGGQTMISKVIYDVISEEVKSESHVGIVGSLDLRGVTEPVFLYSVLPLSLRGRKFHGVYRRKETSDSLTTVSMWASRSSVLTTDVMSLTPVELQKGMKQLQAQNVSLKEELQTLKMQLEGHISSLHDDDISFGEEEDPEIKVEGENANSSEQVTTEDEPLLNGE